MWRKKFLKIFFDDLRTRNKIQQQQRKKRNLKLSKPLGAGALQDWGDKWVVPLIYAKPHKKENYNFYFLTRKKLVIKKSFLWRKGGREQ